MRFAPPAFALKRIRRTNRSARRSAMRRRRNSRISSLSAMRRLWERPRLSKAAKEKWVRFPFPTSWSALRKNPHEEHKVPPMNGASRTHYLRVARAFGTPAYAYDAATIRARCRALKRNFPDATMHYACKANENLSIIRRIKREGFGLETVS